MEVQDARDSFQEGKKVTKAMPIAVVHDGQHSYDEAFKKELHIKKPKSGGYTLFRTEGQGIETEHRANPEHGQGNGEGNEGDGSRWDSSNTRQWHEGKLQFHKATHEVKR